jgi:hypothetical protein
MTIIAKNAFKPIAYLYTHSVVIGYDNDQNAIVLPFYTKFPAFKDGDERRSAVNATGTKHIQQEDSKTYWKGIASYF